MDLELPPVGYQIEVARLKSPIEISHWAKKVNLGSHLYAFKLSDYFFKWGGSRNSTETPGERIYRQTCHFPGWDYNFKSRSGEDIKHTFEYLEIITGKPVHRNDLVINVWDLGKIHSDDLWKLESKMILKYKIENNHYPLGNKDTGIFALNKSKINESVFSSLFEVE
jgi:hypothetical protein